MLLAASVFSAQSDYLNRKFLVAENLHNSLCWVFTAILARTLLQFWAKGPAQAMQACRSKRRGHPFHSRRCLLSALRLRQRHPKNIRMQLRAFPVSLPLGVSSSNELALGDVAMTHSCSAEQDIPVFGRQRLFGAAHRCT